MKVSVKEVIVIKSEREEIEMPEILPQLILQKSIFYEWGKSKKVFRTRIKFLPKD